MLSSPELFTKVVIKLTNLLLFRLAWHLDADNAIAANGQARGISRITIPG